MAEMETLEVGNCTLQRLILMLEQGWKIKSLKYRGLIGQNWGEPCWTTPHISPLICQATDWYEFSRDSDVPKRLHVDLGGFNRVIFEREKLNG